MSGISRGKKKAIAVLKNITRRRDAERKREKEDIKACGTRGRGGNLDFGHGKKTDSLLGGK